MKLLFLADTVTAPAAKRLRSRCGRQSRSRLKIYIGGLTRSKPLACSFTPATSCAGCRADAFELEAPDGSFREIAPGRALISGRRSHRRSPVRGWSDRHHGCARGDAHRTGPYKLIDLDSIPLEQVPAAIAALAARLLTAPAQPTRPPEPAAGEVTWLSVEQAAKKTGRSTRWFYRHAKRLPFVKRLSRKVMLVSEQGMDAWIATRKA